MSIYNLEPVEEKNTSPEGLGAGQKVEGDAQEEGQESEPRVEKQSEKAQENSYEKVLERVQSQVASDDTVSAVQTDADEVVEVRAERQIERLAELALDKGPEHAFKVALRVDDLYTLDKLHDSLSHALYEELLQKGLLKQL